MGVKSKVFHIRYWTYFLTFPDGETWVDSTPFLHDLQFELQNMKHNPRYSKNMSMSFSTFADKMLRKGECHWKDRNGVEHRVKIEDIERARVWGTKRNQ